MIVENVYVPEGHSTISIKFQIQIVESFALTAVNLVDPFADSGFLVEYGAV